MKAEKAFKILIILLLCLCILGFFANWAQNDYGMKLVNYCMLAITACIAGLGFITIKKNVFIKVLHALSYLSLFSCGFFFYSDWIEPLFFLLFFSGLLIPMVLLPLLIFITERRKTEKTNLFNYSTTVFLSIFCIGNSYKISHWSGAGPLLVLSGLIALPFFYKAFLLLSNYLKTKKTFLFIETLLYLFIAFNFIGYIFMMQSWPYGKPIAYLSFLLGGLVLILIAFHFYRKENITAWWANVYWLPRVAFVCLLITSSSYVLRKQNLIPQNYSNDYPYALQYMWDNRNNITTEGKELDRKAEIYWQNYMSFVEKNKTKE